MIHRIRDWPWNWRGLVPGWALDGLCFLDDEGLSTVAQADANKANNRGLGTVSCKAHLMYLCKLDATQFFCPCKACLSVASAFFLRASAPLFVFYVRIVQVLFGSCAKMGNDMVIRKHIYR